MVCLLVKRNAASTSVVIWSSFLYVRREAGIWRKKIDKGHGRQKNINKVWRSRYRSESIVQNTRMPKDGNIIRISMVSEAQGVMNG